MAYAHRRLDGVRGTAVQWGKTGSSAQPSVLLSSFECFTIYNFLLLSYCFVLNSLSLFFFFFKCHAYTFLIHYVTYNCTEEFTVRVILFFNRYSLGSHDWTEELYLIGCPWSVLLTPLHVPRSTWSKRLVCFSAGLLSPRWRTTRWPEIMSSSSAWSSPPSCSRLVSLLLWIFYIFTTWLISDGRQWAQLLFKMTFDPSVEIAYHQGADRVRRCAVADIVFVCPLRTVRCLRRRIKSCTWWVRAP